MKRAYPLQLLRKITPGNRTIDTISPVITHENQQENPYNEILQGLKADRKKRDYPILRPDRENQCRNFT
jgi:hypothetical protein